MSINQRQNGYLRRKKNWLSRRWLTSPSALSKHYFSACHHDSGFPECLNYWADYRNFSTTCMYDKLKNDRPHVRLDL
ncbi:Nonribosomal peptide synthetase [Trichinella spiralis]|uniref:Nonribosomal peptide synthetase n=1 Tax=Trichinella spiralis TaxID=6334 RepID=A0ABR3KIZ3_TRISP